MERQALEVMGAYLWQEEGTPFRAELGRSDGVLDAMGQAEQITSA